MVLTANDIEYIIRELNLAKKLNHRRILALLGDDDSSLISSTLELLYNIRQKIHWIKKGLYAFNPFYEDALARKELFQKANTTRISFEFTAYHEAYKVLGKTFDIAILDLINNLEPNDLGKLMGIVQGGGLYIFLIPNLKTFYKILTRFQMTLVTPQYGPDKIRHIFKKRFIRKLLLHSGICIYDIEEKNFLKRFENNIPSKITSIKKAQLNYPIKSRFPQKIYDIAATQDQINLLQLMELLYEKLEEGKKIVIVVTADRGRGKSSAIGIGLAALAHRLKRAKGRSRIIVTAPSVNNVQEAGIKAKMIGAADQVIILADASKIGVDSFAFLAPLEHVHTLVTNVGIAPEVIEELRESGMEVLVA